MIQQYHACIYIYIYIYQKEMKAGILKRYLNTHIHRSITHDSEKVKAT